jgi:hypothetical protein
VDDKAAEEYIQLAQRHLFLVNNLYFVLSFAQEKRADLQATLTSSAVSA